MTIDRLKEIMAQVYELEFENAEILHRYSITDVYRIFNGIGPECFPDCLREILDTLHPSLVPVALIHDLEFHEGGDESAFHEANRRFYVNGKKAAFAAYAWYDPRRYLVWNKARQFANLCDKFGWMGWGE